MKTFFKLVSFSVILALLIGLNAFVPAQAASRLFPRAGEACSSAIVVGNTADSGAGSLRQAIADLCVGGVITFSKTLAGKTILLNSTLTIPRSLTVNGSTLPSQVTINGNALVRVFSINPSTGVILNGITITGGKIAQNGGGIYNQGNLELIKNVFVGNSAASGGAVYNSGTLKISNSTFADNSATNGGAVYNTGTLTAINNTFSGNLATNAGGGIRSTGNLYLTNNIIANSTGGDCHGVVSIARNNVIEDGRMLACGILGGSDGNLTGVDPQLGALADHDGPAQTFSLPLSSPALDAGYDTACQSAPVNMRDQRGVTRPQGAHCDIGSYETIVLTVSQTGNGHGVVVGSSHISCILTCSIAFNPTTVITLTAKPATGSIFANWLGNGCSGKTGSCTFTMNTSRKITALFKKQILQNGGFNTYGTTTPTIPLYWMAANFSANDGKDTLVANVKEGTAAVRISNTTALTKTLKQSLKASGVAGESLTLSYWVKGNAVPALGKCQAEVTFYIVNAQVGQPKTLPCGTVTATYTQRTLAIISPGLYTNVAIVFTYSKAGGTLWLDGMSLLK